MMKSKRSTRAPARSEHGLISQKRSQGELITTVLIILVVLAAVAVVATFIIRNVRTSTDTAGSRASCLSLDMSIERAMKNESNVSVRRGTGGAAEANLSEIRVYVNGAWKANVTAIAALEMQAVDVGTLAAGDVIEIAPVLTTGVVCDIKDKVTVS